MLRLAVLAVTGFGRWCRSHGAERWFSQSRPADPGPVWVWLVALVVLAVVVWLFTGGPMLEFNPALHRGNPFLLKI